VVAIIKPDAGGALVELDWKPADTNVLDTLARRREGYHDQLLLDADATHEQPAGGAGISSIHDLHRDVSPETRRALVFDRHPRHSFLDHLWSSDTTLERLERADATDLVDLAQAPYELASASDGPDWKAHLVWRGTAWNVPITLTKMYAPLLEGDGVAVAYSLVPESPAPTMVWFAVECNLALLAGDAPDRYFDFSAPDGSAVSGPDTSNRHLASRGIVGPLGAVTLCDDYARLRVRLASSVPFELWRFPVETVSQSEAGYQRTYQQSALYCHWCVRLEPGRSFAVRLTLACARP
jgi:alpha-amylase